MTHMLTLTLEAEGDLLMRDRQRVSNVLRSEPYIRGSVLRGAIADAWIASLGVDETGVFRSLFVGDVEFRGGYPLVPLREPHADTRTMTVPRTVFRSKADGSYVDTALGDERPPGFARVAGLVAFESSGGSARVVAEDVVYRRQRIGTMQDGSGLADVEAGKLFTEVIVASDTRFEVTVVGDREQLEKVLEFLAQDDIGYRVTLGRSRTIMGMAVITAHRMSETPMNTPFDGERHAVLFETDAILLDERLQPALPSARWLAELVGGATDSFRDVDVSTVSQLAVAGWSAVHRGPKPIEIAVERGSVVRFRCDDEAIVGALARRLRRGVGWRNAEGFGVATLDHPIHMAQWDTGAAVSGGPTGQAGATSTAHTISTAAHELAQRLSEMGIGYSMWSGFRNSPDTDRPMRHQSRELQARSGRSAGAGSRGAHQRENLLNAYRGQVANTGWDEAATEELKAAVARELLLLERRNA